MHIGETIASIEEAPVPAEKAAAVAKPSAVPEVAAAASLEDARPSVRRLAEENRVDLATVTGTGPRGQVIKEDVVKAIGSRERPNGQEQIDAPPPAADRARRPVLLPSAHSNMRTPPRNVARRLLTPAESSACR